MNNAPKHPTPGHLIRELLEKQGWSQRVLAIVLKADETALNRMIAGKRPLTAELALKLEEVFGVPAEHFMDLQKSYDLAKARIVATPDPERQTRAHLFGGLPVTEMITRGWIDATDIRNVGEVEKSLAKFFGVTSVDEIEILPHAAKKTNVSTEVTPPQLAWLYRVKEIAREMLVPRYSTELGINAVKELDALLSAPEEARKVPRILSEAGIRFVIVESLTGARIDGVCFWLNEISPVIGMSLRYDRIDNFWFVLRHELEHVIRQHGRGTAMLDVELEGDRAGTGSEIVEQERVANEAAANFCVPSEKLEKFIARKAPFFTERDIIGFARTNNIHPGLVAGQLQRKINRYDRFRNHLVKIRAAVTPGAMVDGWGCVAPTGI